MSTNEKKQEEWPEIKKALESKRYELILSGNDANKRLEELNGQLPIGLFKLTHINLLEISKTSLCQLPNELGQLVNLNQLILHSNKLTELPNNIGKLVKLQHLDISGNNLTELPNEMKNLTDLLTLNLSFNKLAALFEPFHGLSKLAVLNLSNNQFTKLPDDLFHLNLKNLSDLNCSFNQINVLNDNIYELESLKLFNLENNCILNVPGSISKSVKLKELLLKNNKLADNRLRKLIDANKLKAVLEYLERQYEEECNKIAKNASKSVKNSNKNNKKDKDSIGFYEHEIVIQQFNDSTSKQVFYDESVSEVRPFMVCCVIKNLDLKSAVNFKQFLNLQTKLHEDSCEKRTLATIATHDLLSIKGNLFYEAKEADSIKVN
jgi:Leucine-rich repeat (LRR) protein